MNANQVMMRRGRGAAFPGLFLLAQFDSAASLEIARTNVPVLLLAFHSLTHGVAIRAA
jgi:hypothetical protein